MRLARLHGVEVQYTDELGALKTVSPQHIRSILALLRRAPSESHHKSRRTSIIHGGLDDTARSPWLSITPPAMVVRVRALPRVWHIHLPVGKQALSDMEITWTLQEESGFIRRYRASSHELTIDASTTIQRHRHSRLALPFPQGLELGYHHIEVTIDANGRRWQSATRVIVVPQRCYLPAAWERKPAQGGARTKWWGLTIQLYGLRSKRNWGIGDFRDLAALMRWAGRIGAAMVGVNPLHALLPGGISPYSPSSRLFHNPLYLDLEGIAEYAHPAVQRFVAGTSFRRKLDSLRRSDTVDYEAVRQVKGPLLKKLYCLFTAMHLGRGTRRDRAFQRFMTEQGRPLQQFALFQTLQEHLTPHGTPPRAWREWPAEFQHPDSPAVQTFQRRYGKRIHFYSYLEWQCNEQLKRVQSSARRAGMPIGLYTDFAIGVDPNGADAWIFQDDFATGASVGAPPDLFSPSGQCWGLAPPHPARIAETGYRLFVEGFRRNMRHSGLFRLDHAMGLFRLFWVPEGRSAADGAYVTYPSPALLGVLALESQRRRIIVVGEDLGTVTPSIRKELAQAGLLSYRLLFFERSGLGAFSPSHQYPAQAMAAVTTHDLPTLRGFWAGRDIDLKRALGLYPNPSLLERDEAARHRDRQALIATLKKARLLPAGYQQTSAPPELDERLCRAVYTFLARTPSHLLAVPLEDLLGDLETPNLPGASGDAYPVWRIKAGPGGSALENWPRLPAVRMLTELLAQERPFQPLRDTRKQVAS
jgi:4-alpha-glucanotransferase